MPHRREHGDDGVVQAGGNGAMQAVGKRNALPSRILFPPPVVVMSKARNVEPRRLMMKTVMVRYKTTEAHAGANEALVRAVFDELRSRAPAGIRYASYTLPDKVSFVHIATLEAQEGNPLVALPSFRAFQEKLKERCVELPVVTELSAVGSYGPTG